jgi:hypothetical protein
MIGANLSSLEGRLRHCIRYKRGKGGKKVCAKFRAGPGKPKGRRKAGIKRKFVERSTTTKRSSRSCAKWGRGKGGRKVCRKWRNVAKTRVVRGKRKPYRAKARAGKRGACLRRKRSAKTGRMYCAKYAGTAKRKKRTTKARKTRSANGRRASKICIRYGRGKGGRSVCKKFKVVSRSEARKYRAARAKYGRKKIPKSMRLTA